MCRAIESSFVVGRLSKKSPTMVTQGHKDQKKKKKKKIKKRGLEIP